MLQVIEFESNAMMVGHLGLRVSLIAYPVVSVKKVCPPSSSPKFVLLWLNVRTILRNLQHFALTDLCRLRMSHWLFNVYAFCALK